MLSVVDLNSKPLMSPLIWLCPISNVDRPVMLANNWNVR